MRIIPDFGTTAERSHSKLDSDKLSVKRRPVTPRRGGPLTVGGWIDDEIGFEMNMHFLQPIQKATVGYARGVVIRLPSWKESVFGVDGLWGFGEISQSSGVLVSIYRFVCL